MYKDYKVYGPYTRKDGRQHVCLTTIENGVRVKKTVSYPKYLTEIRTGRYLIGGETIDHLNGDVLDNSDRNLQIVSREHNSSKAARRVETCDVLCVWCKSVTFKPTRSQYEKRSSTKAGPFCSRKCTGEYGASLQNGGEVVRRDVVKVSHFTLNKSYVKTYVN